MVEMSRKFSDSEIRAYSKNRYEEKLLMQRLEKLKENFSIFHDTSAKQRQDLVSECKEIRMTTGGSPVPAGVEVDTEFDLSRRVSRPWAYSVMDTTYNVVYKDAVIPLPKKHKGRTRPKSESSRGLTSRSSIYTNRVLSSKSHTSSTKSIHTTQSENVYQRLSLDPLGVNRCDSSPEISRFSKAHTDNVVHFNFTNAQTENGNGEGESLTLEQEVHDTRKQKQEPLNIHDDHHNKTKTNTSAPVTETTGAADTHYDEYSYKPLPELRPVTTVISLPPMYKIDSKDYQEAERERTLKRSRSRVSFSNFVGINDMHERSKSANNIKHHSPDPRLLEHGNEYQNGAEETETEDAVNTKNTNVHNDQNSKTVYTVDPETLHDVRVRHLDEVTYRGRKLKNYIKPEERYKLDPLVMKRRQSKMDKLAKESVSFLKRVNHENIKVEIAFPRSARKRIMTKLVKENNSGKCKTVTDNSGPIIQRKIEEFMHSISDYIHQQQLAREQYYE